MGRGSDKNGRKGRWNPRKALIGLNAAASLALALVLVAMVNYLSYRHYARADWSRSKFYTLSEKTTSLLGSLTNTINVVVFFQPQQDVYEDVDHLLKEYEYASARIRVERVDPDRDLARTEELMRKYKVDQANVVVFDAGGRSKYVSATELFEYDYSPLQYGRKPTPVAFKGEQAFSSAIQSVTQARRPVVYFLQGHGERDIANFSRSIGYSSIAEEVRRDNIEVRPLVFGERRSIPSDCDVLVIAGPDKPFSEPELALVRSYFDKKGRLMILLDARTKVGLEPLLADWGVRVTDDVVLDATRTLSGKELFVTKYGRHPITAKLKDSTSIFYLPRSVEPMAGADEGVGSADKPRVTPLASCSDSGWAETDFAESPMKYDADADRPGPVSIAVAVEKGPVPGIDVQIRPMRLVVIGDSDFAANGAMTGANVDFFMSSLNWLLDREVLMAVSPKPIEQNQLIMNQFQLKALFWFVVVSLPGFVALFGGLVWLRRRS